VSDGQTPTDLAAALVGPSESSFEKVRVIDLAPSAITLILSGKAHQIKRSPARSGCSVMEKQVTT
jgi:hypothetical protein